MYICLLQGCIQRNSLPEGKVIHAHIKKSGFTEAAIRTVGVTILTVFLSDGTVWLPYLVEKIVEVATNGSKPILIEKKLIEGPDANQWGKRWIPLFLAFQCFFIVKPIRRGVQKDIQREKSERPAWEIYDEIGFLLKKSAKTNGWSRRWFVLNEKTGKLGYTRKPKERHFRGVITLEECVIEEVSEDGTNDDPVKSSKGSKKENGLDASKVSASLAFKISNKVPYKTVVKAHSSMLLKAEKMVDKTEWVSKISNIIHPSKGPPTKGPSSSDTSAPMRSSLSDGSLAVVLCQVEKAKDEMLTQLYSSVSAHSTPRIEELLQEDQNAKRKRERYQKQASLLEKLTRQLSVHDTRASSDNWFANGGSGSAASMPVSINEDWRVAFDFAANGPSDYSNSVADSPRISSSSNNGHSRRLSDPGQNGDMNSSRRTPNRLPPPPLGSSVYRY